MDGSWDGAGGEPTVATGTGTVFRSTTVTFVGGWLDGDPRPSRGPSLSARNGGGTVRVGLNLEFFWEMGAVFVGVEEANTGDAVTVGGTGGEGCSGGAP
jgi:hypothetical protein